MSNDKCRPLKVLVEKRCDRVGRLEDCSGRGEAGVVLSSPGSFYLGKFSGLGLR